MIEKMINLSIKHLKDTLKNIPILKQEIEDLTRQYTSLDEENRAHLREIKNLEKEYEHSVFWELLSKSYRQQRNRIENLKEQIAINSRERERISEQIREKRARLDKISERDIKKEIADFNDKQKAVHMLIEKLPSNCQNPRFMSEAVAINIDNIMYDQTSSASVYLVFLQKLKELEVCLENLDEDYINAIDYAMRKTTNQQAHSEFYNIPISYLFKAIKLSVKDGKITDNSTLRKYITMYKNCDGVYNKEYGKMLEHMYEEQFSEVGIYDVDKSCSEEDIKRIFELGIKANPTENGEEAPSISDIAKISHVNAHTFLDILSHIGEDSQGHILLHIPVTGIKREKTSLRSTIWGIEENSDGSITQNYYFLPKNIKGLVRYNTPEDVGGVVTYTGRDYFTKWKKYNKQLYDGSFGLGKEIRIIKEENIDK